MKRYIYSAIDYIDDKYTIIQDPKLGNIKVRNNALLARIGNKIYDKAKHRIGDVVREGASGNYGLIYVDFHDGTNLLKVNPMDDAQRRGRFFIVLDR